MRNHNFSLLWLAGLSADWLGATMLITASAIIYMASGLLGGILLSAAAAEESVAPTT